MNLPATYAQCNPDEQALWWIVRLTADDMGDEEYQQFRRWWLRDPKHAEALAVQSGRWHGFEALLTPEIRAQCAAAMADADEPPVGMHRPRRFVKLAAAAAALAAVLGGWFALRDAGVMPRSYATQTGQNRTVAFKDGSVAYLNTRTRIQWLGGQGDSAVALLEGEALFEIATHAAHPFRVLVDRSEIRVLGTRFNVYRKKNGEVVVTVLEGAVQVRHPAWRRTLRQNQQVAYNASSSPPDVRQADALRVVKWREGAVDINGALSDALEELSRYTDNSIVAEDPRLQSIQVTAVLQVRDARRALGRLQEIVPISVTESQGSFRLAYREPAASRPSGLGLSTPPLKLNGEPAHAHSDQASARSGDDRR